eukprot:GHVN01062845.1.p1 GENE.GHVN01062845.1~~GHVN01062845.1.p1  ORF type:complete len:137 (+),score=29.47 GHVN01062845.1:146-556(+)
MKQKVKSRVKGEKWNFFTKMSWMVRVRETPAMRLPARGGDECDHKMMRRVSEAHLNNEVLLFGTGLHVTYIRPSHPSCHHSHHGDLPNHIPSIISLTGYHITHLSSIYRENCGCEQTPEMFHFQVHPHPLPHLHTW